MTPSRLATRPGAAAIFSCMQVHSSICLRVRSAGSALAISYAWEPASPSMKAEGALSGSFCYGPCRGR